MSLSLAPGVHASCTAPEQVGELKSAVRETGGEGGTRKDEMSNIREKRMYRTNQLVA